MAFPSDIPALIVHQALERLHEMGTGLGQIELFKRLDAYCRQLALKVGTGASTPVANTFLGGTAAGVTSYRQVVPHLDMVRSQGCRVSGNAILALTANVSTPVPFAGADRYDNAGFHDPAVNNTRLVAPVAGFFFFFGTFWFTGGTGGARQIIAMLNGNTRLAEIYAPPESGTLLRCSVGGGYELTAGQYVEFYAMSTATGTSIDLFLPASPEAGMVRVG